MILLRLPPYLQVGVIRESQRIYQEYIEQVRHPTHSAFSCGGYCCCSCDCVVVPVMLSAVQYAPLSRPLLRQRMLFVHPFSPLLRYVC